MDANKIKISIAIALAIILALWGFFQWQKNRQMPVDLKINQTEDVKGLGYTGQRKVAVDSNGNYFVAYRKKYQGKSEIFATKVSFQNGKWSVTGNNSPIAVVGSDADQRVPSIAIDSKNNIYVVWYGEDIKGQINNRQVKFVKSTDGGNSWSSWKNISEVQGYAGQDYWQEHPYILVGKDNILYVVWEGKDASNGNQQIKFSQSSDGGITWSNWKNIQPVANDTQSRPTLVQGSDGVLHLFMYSSNGNSNKLQQIQYATSSDQGNSWSKWQAVSDPAFDSRHVSATVDSSGIVHIAWRAQKSPGLSQIMYRSIKNGTWSDIKQVAVSKNYQFFPSIGADSNGKITMAWMESASSSGLPNEDPTDGKVFVSSLDSSGLFSAPLEINAGSSNLYPQLSEKISVTGVPVLYESAVAANKYQIYFKLIN